MFFLYENVFYDFYHHENDDDDLDYCKFDDMSYEQDNNIYYYYPFINYINKFIKKYSYT